MGTAIDISHLRSIKDRFSFEGKKGFVTGAAGGIGRSTAAALAELGADVALVDINLERALQNAEEINKRFGTHCIALRCDVSDPNSVSTMMAEVLRAYGEVNFVHSNAGIISPDDNGDMPLESWNRMIGVIFFSSSRFTARRHATVSAPTKPAITGKATNCPPG